MGHIGSHMDITSVRAGSQAKCRNGWIFLKPRWWEGDFATPILEKAVKFRVWASCGEAPIP
jgi:hypothetical protein